MNPIARLAERISRVNIISAALVAWSSIGDVARLPAHLLHERTDPRGPKGLQHDPSLRLRVG